jgi:hypothetical protein
MKLRLFIASVIFAAFFSANAGAALQLQTQTKYGVKTSFRSVSGSCGLRNYGHAPNNLLLFCNGWTGKAKAEYDFYLSKHRYGTPAARVYGTKLCCSLSRVKKELVRITSRHYRIIVSVRRPTRFDLRSVTFSYYVKK